MASTMTEVSVNQAIMTDKCVSEFFAGNIKTANTFKLVLLDLTQGAVTLAQDTTDFWNDMTACETSAVSGYTKQTGITLTNNNLPAISSHMGALDFDPVSLNDAEFNSDAYAIVREGTSAGDSPVLALGKWDATKSPAGTGTANFTVTIVSPIRITAGAAA